MFLLLLVQFFGWCCAALPERLIARLCAAIGDLLYFLPTRRRYWALANLHHAFPERSERWRRSIARESLRRLVEMVLFAIASPFFSKKRIERLVSFSEETLPFWNKMNGSEGGITLLPHLTLSESLCYLPLLDPSKKGFGALFRPFDNERFDAWVQQTRERWGLILFSRKKGYQKVQQHLRRGYWVGVLFDFNAGRNGVLIPFLGRVASATRLPGIFAERLQLPTAMIYAQRLGFWRAEFRAEALEVPWQTDAVTIASNQWLEDYLKSSDDACADWVWSQNRWKSQTERGVHKRLHLAKAKNLIAPYLKTTGQDLPKRYRLWVRMPNWLGDVVMALPLIRSLHLGRPDAEITLLAPQSYEAWLRELSIADRVLSLPPKTDKGWHYFRHFYRLRGEYPDAVLLLAHSLRGDIEAWLTGAPQRWGVVLPSRRRPLLTEAWQLPQGWDLTETHQSKVWEAFLCRLGFQGEVKREPFDLEGGDLLIQHDGCHWGLICGTENSPEKRWSVASWRSLIQALLEKYPECQFSLFGTARDAVITAQVAIGFDRKRVIDRAGKTEVLGLAKEMKGCTAVIGNDTGGMHLANTMGVPTVVLFGPTNPLRTGPIFTTAYQLVQPIDSPAKGGSSMAGIRVPAVLKAVEALVKKGQ